MKIPQIKIVIAILFFCSLSNYGKAQNVYCPCQTVTTNLNFYNTHDIECAIMKRVNCLLGVGSKCLNEITISWQNDGLVTYQPNNGQGTVHPFSQNLLNSLTTGVFNGQCGNSAIPVTPNAIQAMANVIYNRIMSQSANFLPNKVTKIRNLIIDYVGLCDCNNQACAYDFHWDYSVVKCGSVQIPNKNLEAV